MSGLTSPLLALLLLHCCCCCRDCAYGPCASASPAVPAPRTWNSVVAWNLALESALEVYQIPFQIGFKYYALLHQAQLQAIKANWKLRNRFANRVAVSTASHVLLSENFPGLQSSLFDAVLANFSATLSPARIAAALNMARGKSRSMTVSSIDDGSQGYRRFIPSLRGSRAGLYQRTPGQTYTFMPQLGAAKSFYAPVAQLKLEKYQPMDPSSHRFQTFVQDVWTRGKKRNVSTYASQTADFWYEGPWCFAPHLNRIVIDLIPREASQYQTARALVLANGAAYDATVATWHLKFERLFWRPVTAINQGFSGWKRDPSWVPQEPTPPSPEYPSGHSATAGALWVILEYLLGSDDMNLVSYSFANDSITGMPLAPRVYTSTSAMVQEVALSRVYAGGHFLPSCTDGVRLGQEVARLFLKNFDY